MKTTSTTAATDKRKRLTLPWPKPERPAAGKSQDKVQQIEQEMRSGM